MAYDQMLAARIDDVLHGRPGVTAKEMFGGIAFLLDGKMFVGVVKDELMVRVGKERHQEFVRKPHARTMDFTGRPMTGYVFVKAPGFARPSALAAWVEAALAHVATLPARKARRAPARKPSGGRGPR